MKLRIERAKYGGAGVLKSNRGHEAILASYKTKFIMVLRNGQEKLDVPTRAPPILPLAGRLPTGQCGTGREKQ